MYQIKKKKECQIPDAEFIYMIKVLKTKKRQKGN